MKNTSKFAGLAVALILASGIGTSQIAAQELSKDHIKASKSALAASGATDQFDRILPSVAAKVKNDIISARPDLADAASTIVDEETLKLAVRRGDLELESAAIYGRIFTVEELKQISMFYSSEAGKKLLKEAPVLTRSLNNASKVWAKGIVRDLNQAVEKRMIEQTKSDEPAKKASEPAKTE